MDTHTEKTPERGEDENDANRMVTPETMSIDVGVAVATLDYLSNITNEMAGLALISERHVLAGREREGDNLGTQARAGCRPHRPPVGPIPGNSNEAEQPLAVATGHAGVTPRSTGE